jgi:hypothetical protein
VTRYAEFLDTMAWPEEPEKLGTTLKMWFTIKKNLPRDVLSPPIAGRNILRLVGILAGNNAGKDMSDGKLRGKKMAH